MSVLTVRRKLKVLKGIKVWYKYPNYQAPHILPEGSQPHSQQLFVSFEYNLALDST